MGRTEETMVRRTTGTTLNDRSHENNVDRRIRKGTSYRSLELFSPRLTIFEYGKHNKIFILPQLGSAPVAILPSKFIFEIMAMPDTRIDIETPLQDTISSDRLVGPGIGHAQSVQFGVVRRQLTRKLPSLTSDVHAELARAMKQQWPVKQEEWTAIKVQPTVVHVVCQAANRVFCGAELCKFVQFTTRALLILFCYRSEPCVHQEIVRLYRGAFHSWLRHEDDPKDPPPNCAHDLWGDHFKTTQRL